MPFLDRLLDTVHAIELALNSPLASAEGAPDLRAAQTAIYDALERDIHSLPQEIKAQFDTFTLEGGMLPVKRGADVYRLIDLIAEQDSELYRTLDEHLSGTAGDLLKTVNSAHETYDRFVDFAVLAGAKAAGIEVPEGESPALVVANMLAAGELAVAGSVTRSPSPSTRVGGLSNLIIDTATNYRTWNEKRVRKLQDTMRRAYRESQSILFSPSSLSTDQLLEVICTVARKFNVARDLRSLLIHIRESSDVSSEWTAYRDLDLIARLIEMLDESGRGNEGSGGSSSGTTGSSEAGSGNLVGGSGSGRIAAPLLDDHSLPYQLAALMGRDYLARLKSVRVASTNPADLVRALSDPSAVVGTVFHRATVTTRMQATLERINPTLQLGPGRTVWTERDARNAAERPVEILRAVGR